MDEEEQKQEQKQNNRNKNKVENSNDNQTEKEPIKIQMSLSLLAKIKGLGKNALAFGSKKGNADFVNYVTNEEKEQLKKKYGNTTRVLGCGKYFGEKALLNNDRRSATIIVDQHLSEILTLEKKYFKAFLDDLLSIVQSRKQTMLSIFPDMSNYTDQKLENMLYCFQPETYTKGMHLCFEGGKEEKIFIVSDGEVQLEKQIRIEGEVRNLSKKKNVQIKLSILCAGGVIGEEVLLNENQNYYYTCTVLSPKSTILVGDKMSIEVKFPNAIKLKFKQMWETKEKVHQEIIRIRKAELEQDAQEHSKEQELKLNLEKAQTGYQNAQKTQKSLKQYNNQNQNYNNEDQNNISESPTNQSFNVKIQSQSNNKNDLLAELMDKDQIDLSMEYQLQKKIVYLNSGRTQKMDSQKESRNQKDQDKLSSPSNYVYDFGDQIVKAKFQVKKKQQVSTFLEKPKIPLENVDFSKKFDKFLKDYKQSFIKAKENGELNQERSLTRNQNDSKRDLTIPIEISKDSFDSQRISRSNIKTQNGTRQTNEDSNLQNNEESISPKIKLRRISNSSQNIIIPSQISNNFQRSMTISRKQKFECSDKEIKLPIKISEIQSFNQRKMSENLFTNQQDYPQQEQIKTHIQFSKTIGDMGFKNSLIDRKSSFQLFHNKTKMSEPNSPNNQQQKYKKQSTCASYNKDNLYFPMSESQNLQGDAQKIFLYGMDQDNSTDSISANNLDNPLTQSNKIIFNKQNRSHQPSITSIKSLQTEQQNQSKLKLSNFTKKNTIGLQHTNSIDFEPFTFNFNNTPTNNTTNNTPQNNQEESQLISPNKKKQLSFQLQFSNSQGLTNEKTLNTEQDQGDQSMFRSRKNSEHQKSQYFEDHKKGLNKQSKQKLQKLIIPIIPPLPQFQQSNNKKGNSKLSQSEFNKGNTEYTNIFADLKSKNIHIQNPKYNKSNINHYSTEFASTSKNESEKLVSYFNLEESPKIKPVETNYLQSINSPYNGSLIKNSHSYRLKQFKDLQLSLNFKKSTSLTKISFASPRLEMMINSNKKVLEFEKS